MPFTDLNGYEKAFYRAKALPELRGYAPEIRRRRQMLVV